MYFAKLEFFNPFSRSIKDRAVFNLIMNAMKRGDINGTRRLFEATSGNVGIAMAAMSNLFGIEFRAYLPKPTPNTTQTLLRVLGAEVVKTEFDVIDREMIEFVKKEAEKANAVNRDFRTHSGTCKILQGALRYKGCWRSSSER
ncbi:MAG: hypothetical protein PWQ92_1618 [Thermococcaceae archaeon]|nr:hypothetical protein [Thermococcaceae archaeon]